jgi:predicted acylesterase/phospholipase RssA
MTEEAPEQGVAQLAEPPDELHAESGLELRLALAMRGGVSLAVWIGGAIAELDLARRGMRGDQVWPLGAEAEQARADAYAVLLRQLGYTDLAIDVLAGASAGGLNAAIFGFAQSVGTDLEWLREVWEEQGDLWRLFHSQWDADNPYRTQAVLNADRFFYRTVREQLEARAISPRPELCSDYLTVDLAATLQSGPPLPDVRTGEDRRPRTAHFRFRRTPAASGAFNDMPASAGDTEAVRRLAYAARATSSFPGAFEPAGVFSWRPTGGEAADRLREPDDDGPENMAPVFSEVALDPVSTFDVMDGGVFDNIPIGRAIQAIADAPAANPTQRILIYLDPSPPHPDLARAAPPAFEGDPPRGQMRARFLRSALTALRYKQTVESSEDDLRELNRMRADAADLQTRRRVFIDALPDVLMQAVDGVTLDIRYRELRATIDAAQVCNLLTAPSVGFLRALVAPPVLVGALGPDDVDLVLPALMTELGDRADHHCETDATALVAATDLFISWLRRFQATPNSGPVEDLGAAKLTLYRVRTFALYLRQRHERDAVSAALGRGAPPADEDGVIDARAVAAALWPASCGAPPGLPDLRTDDGLWAALALADDVEAGLESWAAAGWQALCNTVNDLPKCEARSTILHKAQPPGRSGLPLTEVDVQRLTQSASVALGNLGTTAVPAFHTFSGDQTPLSLGRYPLVAEQGRAHAIDAALAQRRAPEPISDADALNAQSKLAGNQLANFAGFLAADWRTHDWQWGRMDAGAALLQTLQELHSEPDLDPYFENEKVAAFAEARALLDAASTGLNRRKLSLADIAPHRRFALGARLLLGLQRSLWPLTPADRSPEGPRGRDVPAVVALMAFRPLLVLLPLLLRPAVLAGVLVTIIGAHHWAREASGQTMGIGVGLFTVVAVLIAGLLSASGATNLVAAGRWGALSDENSGGFRAEVVSRLRIRAGVSFAGAALIALAEWARLGRTSWLDWLHNLLERTSGFDALVLLTATVAFTLAAARVGAGTVVRARHDPPASDHEGWKASTALVVLTIGLASLATLTLSGGAQSGARVATAVAVGGVVWAVHHAWAESWWAELMAVISALATAFLLSGEVPLGFGPRGQLYSESWSGSEWSPLLDVVLLMLIVVLIFVGGLASRRLTRIGGQYGIASGLLLMLVMSLWSAWQVTLAWPWLTAAPAGLVYGSAVSASTTLFVPFRDQLKE